MSDYSRSDIVVALRNAGITIGDQLFIHSNIGLFGILENAKRPDYYTIFKEAIFEVIGKEGTLVNPTFTYSFCKGETFDIEQSQSTVGLFTELARQDEDAIRSKDANFSIVAIGKHASYFTEVSPAETFGEHSFWERFYEKNGKFLFFNIHHVFPTFLHYVEKKMHVPYRYDKPFHGRYANGEKGCFFHFVKDFNLSANQTSVDKFTHAAYEHGMVKSSDLGRGEIQMITAADCYRLIEEQLPPNPAFLIQGDKAHTDMKALMNQYFDRLYPINRSLTGNGNRQSLDILSEIIDLKITEVPCGTACFDWNVPPEWNANEAWIKDSKGNVVIDFNDHNLHLVGYSEPFQGKMSFEELDEHLYSLPNQPDVIPYITSYYHRRWGFCLTHNQRQALNKEETYEVFIDSSLDEDGSMTIGEAVLPGNSKEEILLTTYICHPSMANNELSGPLVTAFIFNKLKERKHRKYTYRFAFVPETIGSIYYLSTLGDHFKEYMKAGFVVTCVGNDGDFTFKKSRQGDSITDRAVELILEQGKHSHQVLDFFPAGSDERQYCSPGFDLPVGSLMRTMYSKYPEYHTSADDKRFISFEAMEETVKVYLDVLDAIENNETYINTLPYCEPQLGKRGLYPTLGSHKENRDFVVAMKWLLNYSDGKHDLIDIAKRSGFPIQQFYPIIEQLKEKELLELA